MNPIPLIPQSETNFKLYYIVPLVFIYLFHQLGDQSYLFFALLSLFGAVSRHSIGEVLYGPDGEEKPELSDVSEVRRLGTLFHRDKEPSEYSATSAKEMFEEGELQSKLWGVIITGISLSQVLLPVMYLIGVYNLYIYRFEIDFIGGLLLFSLVALVVYGTVREVLPNVSRIAQMDHEIQDIGKEFAILLFEDGISVTSLAYEPAEGGVYRIDCEVDYEYSEAVQEDINRVAVTFCSFVNRSSYPVCHGEINLKTRDDVVISFRVNSMWCRNLTSGKIPPDHYSKLVSRTISVDSPDEMTVKPVF